MIKSKDCKRGAVLFELAIIVPLLLGIGFGGVELARVFRAHQMVSSLAREAANEAFRVCSTVLPPPGPGTADLQDPAACVFSVLDRMDRVRRTGTVSQDTSIRLSVYQNGAGSPVQVTDVILPASGSPSRTSKFAINDPTIIALLRKQDLVVIGEAYSLYEPAILFMPGIFSFASKELYDFAIF